MFPLPTTTVTRRSACPRLTPNSITEPLSQAMELDLPTPQQAPPLSDLAVAIHRAAEAAAALSAPSSSSHAHAAAVSALCDAHAAIGSFLSMLDASSGDDQPMTDGGEVVVKEEDGKRMVGEVEKAIRECALQGSKRRKRPMPPSWPIECRASGPGEAVAETAYPVMDMVRLQRAALNLLLQFHA